MSAGTGSARGALRGIRSTVAVAPARTRFGILHAAQWRMNLALWALASILYCCVYLSVWSAAARASGGSIGGYDVRAFVGYFVVMLVVRELVYTWIPYEVRDGVQTGALAARLLRPLNPLADIAIWIYAFALQNVILVIPVAVLVAVVFRGRIELSVGAGLALLLVLPLAMLVRALCDCLVSLTSFRLVQIEGVLGLYYLIMLLLSGQFAPIAVLPPTLRTAAHILPFYWTLGFPTELAMGRASVDQVPLAVAALAAWSTTLYLTFLIVFPRAVRRLEVASG